MKRLLASVILVSIANVNNNQALFYIAIFYDIVIDSDDKPVTNHDSESVVSVSDSG